MSTLLRLGTATLSALALVLTAAPAPSAGQVSNGDTKVGASVAAKAKPRLRVSPGAPMGGERFTINGKLPTRFKRPVKLQVRKHRRFVTVKSARSTRRGGFTFTARTTRKVTYRVLAPRTRHRRRAVPKVTTRTLTVRPVGQQSHFSTLPAVMQPGGGRAVADNARATATAVFTPARRGRVVDLQRRVDGSWDQVARAKQNRYGAVRFAIGNAAATYRVVAQRYRGSVKETSAADTSGGWNLEFDEPFDVCVPILIQDCDRGLRTDVWDFRALGIHSAESERRFSKSDKGSVLVKDGTLRLTVKDDPDKPHTKRPRTGDGWWLNGHIGTQDKFAFRYGVAAARIKYQTSPGMHGSFWIQTPTFDDDPGNPAGAGAEIDVSEWFGAGRYDNQMSSFIHYVAADGGRKKVGGLHPGSLGALAGPKDAWWKSYHVYSVEWSPNGYVFFIDGMEIYRTGEAVSKREQFLVLSILSSDWELDRITKQPKTMQVDWVRVWQH